MLAFSHLHIVERDYFVLCQVRSGGPTICEDVDGAPVVEPSHSSASGHLQSKLKKWPTADYRL